MARKGPQPFFFAPMYLLYVDESGDTSLKGSTHLLLGAAALFEGKWRWLKSDLEGLLEKFFPNAAIRPSEVHCTDLRWGKGLYSHLLPEQRAELFAELCTLIQHFKETEVTLFAVVYDKAWWFGRNPGASGDDLYLAAFENLVSRFDLLLKRRHSEGQTSKGLIIADHRNSALSTALKKAVLRYHRHGTRWARLQNIIESVLFLQSHESPGLQIADVCSYAVWRLAEFGDPKLAASLRYCFDREPFTSNSKPGEWHGIRYYGANMAVRRRFKNVWKATA